MAEPRRAKFRNDEEEHAMPPAPPSLAGISLQGEEPSPNPPKIEERKPPASEPRNAAAEPRNVAPTQRKPRLSDHTPPTARSTPHRLKLTREGKYFLGITLGVGFAAINTGNNLLYLLLGMLLSLIVISGVMSELSLRGLTVARRLPLRAQVGRPHLVEVEVYNHKSTLPSYAIEVEDLRAGQPADKRCFFLKISPQSAQVAAYRRTPAKRGRDHHTGFRIATRFPFGLFEKSREVGALGDLIIYPAVEAVNLPMVSGVERGQGGTVVARGGQDDAHLVRPMRRGDDPRDIYWRKSAGGAQWVLRERSSETRPDVELVLDVVRPDPATHDYFQGFERRVKEVASHAVVHIKRGEAVVLRTTAGARVSANRTVGADPLLRFLALVDSVERPRGKST